MLQISVRGFSGTLSARCYFFSAHPDDLTFCLYPLRFSMLYHLLLLSLNVNVSPLTNILFSIFIVFLYYLSTDNLFLYIYFDVLTI